MGKVGPRVLGLNLGERLTECLVERALATGESIDRLYLQYLMGRLTLLSDEPELAGRRQGKPVLPTEINPV